MQHRIQLSTNLLIAVKSKKAKKTRVTPKVEGIQIDKMPVEKSNSSVDLLGNIFSNGVKEAFHFFSF